LIAFWELCQCAHRLSQLPHIICLENIYRVW
jgi:hypothetical protein